jgi:hypothetical protein
VEASTSHNPVGLHGLLQGLLYLYLLDQFGSGKFIMKGRFFNHSHLGRIQIYFDIISVALTKSDTPVRGKVLVCLHVYQKTFPECSVNILKPPSSLLSVTGFRETHLKELRLGGSTN